MTTASHTAVLFLAFAVGAVGGQAGGSSAGPGASGQRIFGLSRSELSDAVSCSAEAVEGIQQHLVYAWGKPIEESLAMMLRLEGEGQDPALIEARLRAIYDARPVSAAAWVEPIFTACLKAKAVPLDNERAGDCYLATYFLASQMLLFRETARRDPAAFAVPIQAEVSDKALADLMPRLVLAYASREAGDPTRQNMQDTGGFLKCAAPGEAPVSEG